MAFPDPAAVVVGKDGLRYLNRPPLIDLKQASGVTNPVRLRDVEEVLELMRLLGLPRDLAARPVPFVRDAYQELRQSVEQARRANPNAAEPDSSP